MHRVLFFIFVLCLNASTVHSAIIVDIEADSGWWTINYDDRGEWEYSFQFRLQSAGILTVTDVRDAGDIFAVRINDAGPFQTAPPVNWSHDDWTANYDFAAADSRWSTGRWELMPGAYLISGFVLPVDYDFGSGALRVDTLPVPAPATSLLLAGALGLCLAVRRSSSLCC